MKKKLTPELLFESKAFQVSSPDQPFLYTSGLIGPFYINTHYLCGGKEKSERELEYLDSMSGDPKGIVKKFPDRLERIIEESSTYRDVIDEMIRVLEDRGLDPVTQIVSGGQRRDWFFSIPIATRLGLPHIYLFNNGLVLDEEGEEPKELNGKKALHLADLLTLGSSYTSKWIPYLSKYGVEIDLSYNCVDRLQGGESNLSTAGIKEILSLFKIDSTFFKEALELGVIDREQSQMISSFLADNKGSMKKFLLSHPDFISDILTGDDEKSKKRVHLLLDHNLYDLPEDFLSSF